MKSYSKSSNCFRYRASQPLSILPPTHPPTTIHLSIHLTHYALIHSHIQSPPTHSATCLAHVHLPTTTHPFLHINLFNNIYVTLFLCKQEVKAKLICAFKVGKESMRYYLQSPNIFSYVLNSQSVKKNYRWSQNCDGLTYDFSTIQWYESNMHSVQTVLWILIFSGASNMWNSALS